MELYLYFFALFLIIFGIPFLLFHFGDWKKLQAHFGSQADPTGKRFKWVSINFELTSYRNAMMIWVSEEGFFMKPQFILRFTHGPILIPWSHIVHLRRDKNYFWDAYTLTMMDPFKMSMTIRGKAGKAVRDGYNEWLQKRAA